MIQNDALKILKMGENVFLTGEAGSGKTHVLRNYISYLNENGIGVALTASTGIAATHIGGITIHAWSGLGIRNFLSERDIDDLESKQHLWKRYENTKVIIIDEISMLHHFRLDLVDTLCRSFKRNDKPFGGMQVVLCGDFFQLPPISRPNEPEGHFAYASKVWEELHLKVCYLEESYRQDDATFISLLKGIRENRFDEEMIGHLKLSSQKSLDSSIVATKLSTHNENVDKINEEELSKISGKEKSFEMTHKGKSNLVEALAKSVLAPEKLILKIGARVMFVKNNFEKKYSNGTLGIVEGYDSFGYPIVATFSGKKIVASPETWRIEEDGKVKAEISQVPLRLAWAITIHKSQGMSLDAAEIDLTRSFAPGMGYVALSRVRNLKGLFLKGFNAMALAVHPEVFEIDQDFKKMSKQAESFLEFLGKDEIEKRQKEFVLKNGSIKKEKEESVSTHYKTKLLILEKLPLEKIASARNLKEETILSHIEKLLEEGEQIDIEYIKRARLSDSKFNKIKSALLKIFKKEGNMSLSPVKTLLGSDVSYFEIRLSRLFVRD